jgi:hypothetical protein
MRIYVSYIACKHTTCDFHPLTNLKVKNIETPKGGYIGISRLDPILGYVPKEGFDAQVLGDGWPNINVKINHDGLRSNGNKLSKQDFQILAVGDSFVFGDQVNNEETWPACLEKQMGVNVSNGGVFGYGAAQSLLRAQLLLKQNPYNTVILAIYLNDDIGRDQLSYRFGFPKPALIYKNDGIIWSSVPDAYAHGTKYNPSNRQWPGVALIYENSILFGRLVDYWYQGTPPEFFENRLTLKHPQAASQQDIIRWTLTQLTQLPVARKMLLLQYPSDLDNSGVAKERVEILKVAKELSIEVVDSFDELHRYPADQLWSGHHTSFGNQVICNLIQNELRKNLLFKLKYSYP